MEAVNVTCEFFRLLIQLCFLECVESSRGTLDSSQNLTNKISDLGTDVSNL